MAVLDDSWRDKSLTQILAEWDVILHETDTFRQKPILSRAEAKRLEEAEKEFQMIQSLMIGEYRRPEKIHWWYRESKEWG